MNSIDQQESGRAEREMRDTIICIEKKIKGDSRMGDIMLDVPGHVGYMLHIDRSDGGKGHHTFSFPTDMYKEVVGSINV